MEARYGNKLQIGDFILMAIGNVIQMGWYCGEGNGTLQYYSLEHPAFVYELYEKWERTGSYDWGMNFEKKGFTTKSLTKSYVYESGSVKTKRIIKIDNPETLFTERKYLDEYLKSKEALLHIKFLNK